jgi:hypothetical protein
MMSNKQLRGVKNGHENTKEHHVQVVVVHGGAHTVLTKQIFEAEQLVHGGVVNESYFGSRFVRFSFKALYRAVEKKPL